MLPKDLVEFGDEIYWVGRRLSCRDRNYRWT